MPQSATITKVVFTYAADDVIVDAAREALPNATVVAYTDDTTLRSEIVDADLTVGSPISAELLAIASQLAWHHVPWVGVERAAIDVLAERGILLTNSSGINAIPIAEHIVGFMLMFARRLDAFVHSTETHSWPVPDLPPTFELTDQRVVILGTGAIGQATAGRLRPFGCRIIGVRRRVGDVPGFDEVIRFDELPAYLAETDHLVNTLPMSAGTRGIVSKVIIDGLKPGACFYNVGRGGTVDQPALIDALTRGQLRGAGLDVCAPEPLPVDDPLWSAPNVVITNHTAGASPLSAPRAAALLKDAIRRYLAGEPIPTEVDLSAGY